VTPFSHLSFLRKLTLFVLAATIFALSMTFVALTLYERSSFRQARHNELSLLASTLGQNSAASLAFNDQKTATDILAALQADPHSITACLFDNAGRVFADCPHPRPPGYCSAIPSSGSGAQFAANSLSWYQDVFLKAALLSPTPWWRAPWACRLPMTLSARPTLISFPAISPPATTRMNKN
jgi:hypothetical protein